MGSADKLIDRGALYYPHVHIHDAEWLKATMLCFPSLERMVPETYAVKDAAVPRFFSQQEGRLGRPMLGVRNLDDDDTVVDRQALLNKIESDVEHRHLTTTFSHDQARTQFGDTADEFQIHEYKLGGKFMPYLESQKLAWTPRQPRTTTDKWYSLHPVLGRAILATNAVALARRHDLEIVTESGPVHSALLGATAADVYDAMVWGDQKGARSEEQKVNDLFRYVVVTEFDLSELSLEEIVRLNLGGGDVAALKSELLKQVSDLGAMPTREVWNDALRVRSRDVVQNWAERDSFARTLRRFGVREMSDDLKEFAVSAAGAAVAGTLASSVVLAIPGLVIGVLFASTKLWSRWQRGLAPYQFLSRLEKAPNVRRRHVLDFSPI